MSKVSELIATDGDWLQTLQSKYQIHVTRDGDLVSLKYNQIESPMHEPIVQECRGMVVNAVTGKVLAHPYNKFWNHGDPFAAPIDWSTARVLEKLDGSLMTLYWSDELGKWEVASSGTPRAGGAFDGADKTFRDAFWEVWEALGYKTPRAIDQDSCFMFELCTLGNRIVVLHDKPRLVLHGARNMRSGFEWSSTGLEHTADRYGWELVKSFPITSIDDCLAAADAVDPIKCEGFIVVDAEFNRVKIKSPRYVILHHMKGEATMRRSIELWQTGEATELLTYFPEMAAQILPVHERLDMLAAEAVFTTSKFRGLARKDFAGLVKDRPIASLAFKLYGTEPTLELALGLMRGQTTQSLERMLEAQS